MLSHRSYSIQPSYTNTYQCHVREADHGFPQLRSLLQSKVRPTHEIVSWPLLTYLQLPKPRLEKTALRFLRLSISHANSSFISCSLPLHCPTTRTDETTSFNFSRDHHIHCKVFPQDPRSHLWHDLGSRRFRLEAIRTATQRVCRLRHFRLLFPDPPSYPLCPGQQQAQSQLICGFYPRPCPLALQLSVCFACSVSFPFSNPHPCYTGDCCFAIGRQTWLHFKTLPSPPASA